jgi:hypothetical protein
MNTNQKTKPEIIGKETPAECIMHGKSPDGSMHIVAIWSLKVVIVNDGPTTWFAQGLDIDYAAEGSSVEDAKKNFQNGLLATIHQHLKAYSNLSKMAKPAPTDVWQELYYGPLLGQKKQLKALSSISIHLPDQIKQFTVFENLGIEYFELSKAA